MTGTARARVIAQVVMCAAAAVVAGLVYEDLFADRGYLLPLLATGLLATLLAGVAAGFGWRAGRTTVAAAAGFVLLTPYTAAGHTLAGGLLPTTRTARELARGLTSGISYLLTVNIPADVTAGALVVILLLTWIAAFTATTLALRTHSPTAPVVPVMAVFFVDLSLVAPVPTTHLAVTTVFLTVITLLVLLQVRSSGTVIVLPGGHPARDMNLRRRRPIAEQVHKLLVVSTVTTVVVVGGFAGSLLPIVSDQHRADPRSFIPPPTYISGITPLATIKSQLREDPPRRLFDVRVLGADSPTDLIRVAALDSFDGLFWSSDDRYLLAGHRFTPDYTIATPTNVTLDVTISSLTGPFLPVVGWPTSVDWAPAPYQLGFSSVSGVLVRGEQSLTALHYKITGELRTRDAFISSAAPTTNAQFARYTVLPTGLPTELKGLAKQLTAEAVTAYDKLVTVERLLRAEPYSLDAQPGQSYAAISRLLVPQAPDDDEGYAEQHASAFAVLARELGYPARVAVGYRLPPHGDGPLSVTTRDAHAWAEVHFDGYGWVSFDPTDFSSHGSAAARPLPLVSPPSHITPVPTPTALMLVTPGSGPGRPSPACVVCTAVVAAMVATATAGASLIFLVVLGKVRRRRRRRNGVGAVDRVLGAWREARDRLVETGMQWPSSATAREVAETYASRQPSAAVPLATLADIVTEAVFSGVSPSESLVGQAWRLEAAIRANLYRGRMRMFRRLQAWFDPRPLLMSDDQGRRGRRSARSGLSDGTGPVT